MPEKKPAVVGAGNVGSLTKKAEPARTQPYIDWLDPKTALIVADDYAQFVGRPDAQMAFAQVFKEADKADRVIFDLRDRTGEAEVEWVRYALEPSIPRLLTKDLILGSTRHRMHSGYVPQDGMPSGGYFSAWVTHCSLALRALRAL